MTYSNSAAAFDHASIDRIRTAQSCATDTRQAVQEFHAAVAQPGMELVVFFCSSEYDLDILAAEMRHLFAGIRVVGCTTAGEIGPAGYCTRSLSGASFPAKNCVAVSGVLNQMSEFRIARAHDFVQTLLQQLEDRAPGASPDNSFAFMLIDGMSVREEAAAHALQNALGNILLFGGSAGDDLNFAGTHVYSDGYFHPNSTALILVSTSLPFRIFMTQHFVSSDARLVVTQADTTRRIVRKINGLPAAQVYAQCIGVEVNDLNPMHFAASPVVVKMDGSDYVRSIQKMNADGSLTFLCAIEEGLVLRVAHGEDMVENLEQTLGNIRQELGPPQLVLGCDCVLRNLEMSQRGLKDRIEGILWRNNAIGFSSYGEQIHGIHVNQTLTGIAIGSVPASSGIDAMSHRERTKNPPRDLLRLGNSCPNGKDGHALPGTIAGISGADTDDRDLPALVKRQNAIIQALIQRAEHDTSIRESDFNLFQTAITLENQVRLRTSELKAALQENEKITRALRASENHHRILVENSPVCIHEISMAGRITSMNRAGLVMMGLEEESQVCGFLYLDAVCDADRGRIEHLLEKAYEGETSQFEFTSSGPDPKIYKSCFVPIKNKHGVVEELMGITEDITERMQAGEMLRKLSTAVEQSSASVVITDLDACIEYVNPRFAEVTGYGADEAIGQNPRILQSGKMAKEIYQEMWAKLTGGLAWKGELLNKRKNGELYWEETNVAPVKNLAGEVSHYVAVKTDISERKLAEEGREEALSRLQKIASRVPGIVYQFRMHPDGSACFPFASEAMREIFLVSPDEVLKDASKVFARHHPDDHAAIMATLQQSACRVAPWQHEFRIRLEDGTERWMSGNALPEREADGSTLWHGFIKDITERRHMEEQVRQLAFHDGLTGLPNRRLLNDRLSQTMATSKRSGGFAALMFLDIDNFKPINDLHGHDVGDLLLIEAAGRLRACVREMDTVARFGGDEFVVVLTELGGEREAAIVQAGIVAEKIRIALAKPYVLKVQREGTTPITIEHQCSVSIGVVLFVDHEASQDDILKWADTAMYQAKSAGRNLIRYYDTAA